MKNIFLTIVCLVAFGSSVLALGGCDDPEVPCSDANPFCTTNTYNFPNETNTCPPSGPNYGCLSDQPDPVWYYMEVDQSGTFVINLVQTSGPNGTGTVLDVDFAMYGPFASLATGCTSVNNGVAPIQSSYSSSNTETIGIGSSGGSNSICETGTGGATTPPAAIAGQVYVVLITNYSQNSGYISFNQTGGTGIADCAIVTPCDISSLTANPSPCVPATNTFTLSGSIAFTQAPTTGTLTVTSSCGGSQVFNAPFTSPLAYSLPNLASNGAACSVTATFSADNTCSLTTNYTAPSSCTTPTCAITSVSATPGNCLAGNTYDLSGSVAFTNAPAIGTLTVTNACGGSQTFNAPFTSPLTYNLPGLAASGTSCQVTASFSATSCQLTQNYTSPAVPVTNAGTDVSVCTGNQVTLSGSGATTYSWLPVVTNGVAFTPSATATYTVTGTNAVGCSSTDDVLVTVNSLPIVNAGNDSSVCQTAGNVVLVGSPTGGTFSGTGITGNSFNPSAGTQVITYNFVDGNSCPNSDQLTITVEATPVVDAGNYGPFCSTSSNVNLVGTPSGGTFSGTGVSGNIFSISSGTQTIVYNYSSPTGCPGSDNATIVVNTAPVVDAGNYPPLCADATPIALVGTPAGGTFTGTGVTSNTFSPTQGSQTVTYSLTDGNGCQGSDAQLITVFALPNINAGSDVTICEGQSVTFSGSGGVSYIWNNGIVDGQTIILPAGQTVYTVIGTDANGCKNTDNVVVSVGAMPIADAIPDVTTGFPSLTVNFINNSSVAPTYLWNFGNGATGTTNNLNTQTATYTIPGTYWMILTASNGACSTKDTVEIIVLEYPDPVIELPNVFTPNGDHVNDVFFINATNTTSIEFIIINRWGNKIFENEGMNPVWDGTSNGKNMDEGVYFVKYHAIGINGETYTGQGNITLVRE